MDFHSKRRFLLRTTEYSSEKRFLLRPADFLSNFGFFIHLNSKQKRFEETKPNLTDRVLVVTSCKFWK